MSVKHGYHGPNRQLIDIRTKRTSPFTSWSCRALGVLISIDSSCDPFTISFRIGVLSKDIDAQEDSICEVFLQ